MKKIITALVSACSLFTATANAGLYKAEFNFTDFAQLPEFGNVPAPQRDLVGSILFTAESLSAPVTSIDEVDLTINGHSYTTNEVGMEPWWNAVYLFGGTLRGVNVAIVGTHDFFFLVQYDGSVRAVYADPGYMNATWESATGNIVYTEVRSEVPEPSSLALLLAGAGGLGAMLRRRRRA